MGDIDPGVVDLRVVVEFEEFLEEFEDGGLLNLFWADGCLDLFSISLVPGIVHELLELTEDKFAVLEEFFLDVELLEDGDVAGLLEEENHHEGESVAAEALLAADSVDLAPMLDEEDDVANLRAELDVFSEELGVGDTHEVVEGDFHLEVFFGVLDGEEGNLDLGSKNLLVFEVLETALEEDEDFFELRSFVLLEPLLGEDGEVQVGLLLLGVRNVGPVDLGLPTVLGENLFQLLTEFLVILGPFLILSVFQDEGQLLIRRTDFLKLGFSSSTFFSIVFSSTRVFVSARVIIIISSIIFLSACLVVVLFSVIFFSTCGSVALSSALVVLFSSVIVTSTTILFLLAVTSIVAAFLLISGSVNILFTLAIIFFSFFSFRGFFFAESSFLDILSFRVIVVPVLIVPSTIFIKDIPESGVLNLERFSRFGDLFRVEIIFSSWFFNLISGSRSLFSISIIILAILIKKP